MQWSIERRRQSHDPYSEHLKCSLTGVGAVYDASLKESAGVRRTTRGGATRTELSAFDPPLQGVYHWDAETEQPHVVICWREEEDGPLREHTVMLGVS